MQTKSKSGIFKPKKFGYTATHLTGTLENQEPLNFATALKIEHWRQAMEAEMNALKKIETWTLIPYSSKYNLVVSES